jgi:RNA polymerase sigma factor (sigma-70 family)
MAAPIHRVSVLATLTWSETVERVYRDHGPRIWRALFAYVRDRDVATDALAEAFAQLLARGDAVRDPVGWTWRVAFRIAAGELKERARRTYELPDLPVHMSDPLADFMQALDRLSPKQRATLVLHHYAGYRVKEIAAILATTSAAVKVHLSAGRKRLRQVLEESDDG